MNFSKKQLVITASVLALVLVLTMSVTIWALFFRESSAPPITPDYPAQGEEYAKSCLTVGGYNGELVVRAYDPDTGEKAMVDTKAEITIDDARGRLPSKKIHKRIFDGRRQRVFAAVL